MVEDPNDRYRGYSIGRRLARFRTKKRLSQAALGRVFRRSGASLSQLERGKVDQPVWMLAAIATHLDAHPVEVIAGFSAETCKMAEELESMSSDRRTAAIRLFHAAQEMATAATEWQGQRGR